MCREKQCIFGLILEIDVLWTILTLPCLDFALQECGEFWLENALSTSTWFAVKKICVPLADVAFRGEKRELRQRREFFENAIDSQKSKVCLWLGRWDLHQTPVSASPANPSFFAIYWFIGIGLQLFPC